MKFIALIVILVSCSQLSTTGRLVQVWDEMTPENSTDYRELGEVKCVSNMPAVTTNFNRKRCKEGLRNAAARIGGAAVVIEKEVKMKGKLSTGVQIKAIAYKYIRQED